MTKNKTMRPFSNWPKRDVPLVKADIIELDIKGMLNVPSLQPGQKVPIKNSALIDIECRRESKYHEPFLDDDAIVMIPWEELNGPAAVEFLRGLPRHFMNSVKPIKEKDISLIPLWCGPWIGEFGWELFHWQAYIRSFSNLGFKTIVVAPPHHKFLYEDHCHVFIEYETKVPHRKICERIEVDDIKISVDHWHTYVELMDNLSKQLPNEFIFENNRVLTFSPFRPYIEDSTLSSVSSDLSHDTPLICRSVKQEVVPEYIKFGNFNSECEYDYIFQIRDRKFNDHHNWNISCATKVAEYLISKGKKIGFVGTKTDSAAIPKYGEDLRGMDLKEEADIYQNCKAIIGPSSAPIHFAALCGCSQIVWSGTETDKDVHEVKWNPFDTEVHFISEGCDATGLWNPSAESIIEKIKLIEKE
jgi:hypothetical protein